MIGAGATQVLRYVIHTVFYSLFINVAKGDDEKTRIKYAKKCCEHLFRFIYFSTAAFWGWYVLHNNNFLYEGLGGPKGGTPLNMVKDGDPSIFDSFDPALIDYSLYTYGFHFGNLIQHFIEDWGSTDFYEMFIHHIAANSLYFGYINGNIITFGSTVAYLHDIADVPANLGKVLSSTRFELPSLITGLFLMVSWGYTRIYYLP